MLIENGLVINKLQILNIVTNKWLKQGNIATIPINIASSSCWLSMDSYKVYTFGGKSSDSSFLRDIYRFVLCLFCLCFVYFVPIDNL